MVTVDTCPICGNSEFKEVFKAPFFRGKEELFSIKECKTCAFWVTSPRPLSEHLGAYYEQESYASHSDDAKGFFDRLYKVIRTYALNAKSNLVKSLVGKGASVLDYGAGGGAFVQQLRKKGFKAEGMEPSGVARKNALEVHGLTLFTPEALDPSTMQYNAITLWHVLEHLPELNERLQDFHKSLVSKGVLVIAVPNHESLDAKYYGAHWAAMDVPLHLWHFKKQNIRMLAEKHGFTVEAIHNMPFDSFYVSMLSEKVRGTNNLLRALMKGLQSNVVAGRDNASSLIYVLRKR
jgi:2-polyprenyl-3-methyl-5-hydroxy-6-metoxy-1,4-benzoquinol methylase